MQEERYHTPAPTKRLVRTIVQRKTAFVALERSAGATLAGLPPDVDVVHVVGRRPLRWLSWALAELPPTLTPGRHYTRTVAPVFRYTRADGSRLEVHTAASWFVDDSGYSIDDARTAYDVLARAVARSFPGAVLLATPATTGRELFLRSIPREREFPVLDNETQELIRATSGQGRIEVCASPWSDPIAPARALPKLRGVFEYDGRLMYAALCWGLRVGAPERVRELHDIRAQARYLVRVTVPRDWWEPFGLLGVKDNDGSWYYPHERGRVFDTWCDAAELFVAHRCGWSFDVRDGMVWPALELRGRGRPLDTWSEKLVRMRAYAVAHAHTVHGPVVADLVGNAIRALLLHTIGSFHGRGHYETHAVPIADAALVPSHVRPLLEGEYLVWQEERPAAWKQLSHPEWSAAVWARARARLLMAPQGQGALQRTGGDVIAFRTDAIYLTEPQLWHDDGRVGRYRLKRRGRGEWDWPASHAELLAIRAELEGVR